MRLSLFLLGYRRVHADSENASALLNVCLEEGVSYVGFSTEPNGEISFFVSASAAKRLLRCARLRGISIRVSTRGRGFPFLLRRYRWRLGLIIGALFAIALLFLSERFVWDVRVKGNVNMTEEEVIAELRACGFGVGSYIPDLSTPELENRVLILSDRISWISVYMDGTVAVVQVIEHTEPPLSDSSHGNPANLIAACDGQIEYLQLYRGQPVVVVGQAVKKGELLVSGIFDSEHDGYRYTRAAGMVMARTEHRFTVEIPLAYEEKVYTDAYLRDISFSFFDFSLKIYKSTGNEGGAYDIIKEEKEFDFLGLHDLPISFQIERARPYVYQSKTRSPQEALELAYAELDTRLSDFSEPSQLLKKEIQTTLTEDTLILDCTVYCIENIAVQSEFEIVEPS